MACVTQHPEGVANSVPRSLLLRLDQDAFRAIVDQLVSDKYTLLQLSLACKSIRNCCMPVLFSTCTFNVYARLARPFIPESLRCHIRSLTLVDKCRDIAVVSRHRREGRPVPRSELTFTDDPLLCGVYDSDLVGTVLRAMPSLRSVSLEAFSDVEHGIPWPVLEAIITVPHLEAFSCRYHNLSPAAFHRPGIGFAGISQALTRFEFTLRDYRRSPRMYQPEMSTLDFVLRECHKRLEVLTIPAECAPFHTMCGLDWPALRELRLRGVIEPGNEPADPFVVAFACMPRLRVLELRLALPPNATPKPLWPPGVDVTYPWPELQQLVVSSAQPDDLLWPRLPSTLRSLTLIYSPHLSTHLWAMENHRVDWHWPPTKPADLLRILQACSIPTLDRLGLEYHADDDEDALLSYVGTTYSQLTALKVFRYQIPLGTHKVDIANLVQPLRSLTRLKTLQMHLDLPETGYTTAEFVRYIAREYMMIGENPTVLFHRALDEAANLLARHVGPFVEVVKLPRRNGGESSYQWVAYKVVRDTEGGPRAQYDEYLTYGRIRAPVTVVINTRRDSESRDSEVAQRYPIVIPPQDLRPIIIGA